MTDKTWSATVLEDPEDSEQCILQFPEEMIAELKWVEGDTLVWDTQDDGSIIIRKK